MQGNACLRVWISMDLGSSAILAATFLHGKFKLSEFRRELEQFQHSHSSLGCAEELAAMGTWVVLFRFPGECQGDGGAVSNGRGWS